MADIPINPVTRRVEFTGNTGTGPFAFTFNVLAQADIAAYKNNTLLALTSDYTVSLNSNGTGSITLASALIATDELVIIGDLALSRTTDFVTAGDLLASSLNEQFDSNVVMSQQLDERFDRTIRSQPGDINKNLYLPLVSSRASQLLSFDSSGNITTTSLSNVPDIGTVNLTVSGVASFADGSASAPSITNIGDTNTGMYFGAADQINFSVSGSEVISVASTGTTISGLSISSGDILLTDNSATALEIKEGSNNYLTFITTNGSEKLSFGSTANPTFEVNGSFRQPLIAATTSFFSQTYSGATLSATNGAVNIESYSASKAGIVLNGSGDQITFTSPTLGFVGLVQVVGAITTNTSLNIASSTTVTGILDEDDMSSNSDTKLATQQSIKAYVDAQVGTVDTLAEVLGNGNTTGGTNIVVSANDVISLDDGTNALPSLTTTGDLNTGIYFPAADEVGITTGGTQRVKVDSTGVNVTGTVTVGTLIDTPDIETSTVSARDGTTSFSIADSTGTATFNNSLTISRNSGTGVLPTLDIICTDNTAIQNQILGALDFQTSDTNEAGTLASIQARKTNSTSASTNLAALELYTGRPGDLIKAVTINADQTTSFAAAIDVTGTVTATGTSVFASLDISGDIDVDGTTNLDATNIVGALDVTGTITSDGLTVKNPNVSGEQVIFKIENAANTGTIGQITYNQTDDSMAISNESTGILRFDTTAIERMRIDSSGRVGIGTSDPSSSTSTYYDDLVIKNDTSGSGAGITLQSNTSNGFGGVEFRKADGSEVAKIYASSAGGQLGFETGGSTVMQIDSSGNVGIGTSLPSAPLHLVGSALVGVNDFGAYDKDDANLLISNGNNGTSILLHDGSGAYHSGLVKYDTNVMSLGLNNSNDTNSILTSTALNITSTGVGIGMSPDSSVKLSVSGAVGSTNGSEGSPTHTFYGDPDTGMFRAAADTLAFSTGGSEAMRINSGHLLVGKTSADTYNNTNGIELQASGLLTATRTGIAQILNREDSDGDIVAFRKDGATVGSISTYFGNPMFGKASGSRLAFDTSVIYSTNDAGTTEDGSYDLGTSGSRFKDLYLSGGVYLGGTGSANKLDDYEEGTWTPVIYQGIGSIGLTEQHGFYRKIGSLVYADFYLQFSAGTGSSVITLISGLPFNQPSGFYRGGGNSSYADVISETLQFYGSPGTDRFAVYHSGGTALSFSTSVAGKYIIGTFIYIAA